MELTDVLVLVKEDIKQHIPVFVCGEMGSGKTMLTTLISQTCFDSSINSMLILDEIKTFDDINLVKAAVKSDIPVIATAHYNNPEHVYKQLDMHNVKNFKFRYIYLDRTFREKKGNVAKCDMHFVRYVKQCEEGGN